MNYILPYSVQITNYSIINMNNLFNFLFIQINTLQNDKEIQQFINNMKIQLGNSITTEFKNYIFRKIDNSPILRYF